MSLDSDQEVIDSVLAGNRNAFSTLVDRYKRSSVGVAYGIVGDKHIAEEIAQDAFTIAYQKLGSLRNGNAFGPWLLVTARRLAIREVQKNLQARSLADIPSDAIAESLQEPDGRTEELLDLIQQLPKHERSVVMLKYFDQHKVGDIAVITDQSTGTVTKQLSRARKRLLTWLKERDNECSRNS